MYFLEELFNLICFLVFRGFRDDTHIVYGALDGVLLLFDLMYVF